MKNFLLLLTVAIPILSFAQFSLEHSYPEGLTKKITLEYSGDKYYVFDNTTNTLKFYNTDHSFWKSIAMPVPAGGTLTYYDQISESVVDPNPEIEVVYSYTYSFNGEQSYVTKVISENGFVYLTVPDSPSSEISHLEGLPDKLLVDHWTGPSDVYSLPFPTLEHSYPGILKRIVLENSGEKYSVLDYVAGILKLYNPDHSLWKTIALPFPSGALFYQVSFVSESAIDGNSLVEVAYIYNQITSNGYVFTGKIINENGVELLSEPNVSDFKLNKIDALPTKLMATGASVNVPFTNVYELPSLSLEHSYAEIVGREKLELSGEKYFSRSVNADQVIIYNSDHSIWKTISLPVINGDFAYHAFAVNDVTETTFDSDANVEVTYSAQFVLGNIAYFYSSAITDESQNLLFTVPDAANLYLIKVAGENKLLANIKGNGAFEYDVDGQVYGINALKNVAFEKKQALVYPNPAADVLHVIQNDGARVTQISIYNMLGILVKQENTENITEIHLENIASGAYLLELRDANGKQSTYKIIVAH